MFDDFTGLASFQPDWKLGVLDHQLWLIKLLFVLVCLMFFIFCVFPCFWWLFSCQAATCFIKLTMHVRFDCPRRGAFKVKPSPHRTTFTGTPAAKWSTAPVLPVMLLLRCGAWWWWGRRLGPFIRSGAPACSTPDTSTKSIYAASAQTPNTCCLSARGIAAGWRTATLAAATWGIRGSILRRCAADAGWAGTTICEEDSKPSNKEMG